MSAAFGSIYTWWANNDGSSRYDVQEIYMGENVYLTDKFISDGNGGGIFLASEQIDEGWNFKVFILKSSGEVREPTSLFVSFQSSGISLGSYGDGGAVVSWTENLGDTFSIKYVFIDSAGNLVDPSDGKFPGVREEVQFKRGDANGDEKRDLSDAVFILNYLFTGGKAPSCFDAADSDDTGRIDLSDAVFLLNHLFSGGPAPPEPLELGVDPTPDELPCEGESDQGGGGGAGGGDQRLQAKMKQIKKRIFFKR